MKIVKDPLLLKYTKTFLERNFYRNLIPRTRAKPNESLWSLWFGSNQLVWGLLIAPAYRVGAWTNDVSEIRRASYMYWTVGHVLSTGLINPASNQPMTFSTLSDLLSFYRSILKRVSQSQYEQEIAERYVRYLERSSAPLQEPFLVPELRYAGLDTQHQYRLDFSIFNSHTMEFVGFELSPHSTHMAISGIKSKTQIELNRELAQKWASEMKKRNDYFKTFDITVLTFTDEHLANLETCFAVMADHLSKRPASPFILEEELNALANFSTN